ncbi:Fic family protein [Roseobacter sp. N2S]|nr:Fic family protein [Roseobacter sp. N2S]
MGQGLHPDSAAELADFVRVMNCYYSNLIEGHNTRPRDIEKALAGAKLVEETRPLALKARAHVIVQRHIDDMFRAGTLPPPTSVGFLTGVHRMFYDEMPAEFRVIHHPDGTTSPIIPSQMRQAGDAKVAVGRHRPPSSSRPPSSPCVAAFMDHFDKRFQIAARSASGRIIAIASAHHRLNSIHPFPDGNGRVSRLMSHAMALNAGIGGIALWSISRGLARGVTDRGEYKRMMDMADSPRRGDRDGRGNLSEAALKTFCAWFLNVALDQVTFSAKLFDLGGLDRRYRRLVSDLIEDKRAPDLISAVLRHGALERGETQFALKTSERTARNTLKRLTGAGFYICLCESPVRLGCPLDYRQRLFPNLFADTDLPAP